MGSLTDRTCVRGVILLFSCLLHMFFIFKCFSLQCNQLTSSDSNHRSQSCVVIQLFTVVNNVTVLFSVPSASALWTDVKAHSTLVQVNPGAVRLRRETKADQLVDQRQEVGQNTMHHGKKEAQQTAHREKQHGFLSSWCNQDNTS